MRSRIRTLTGAVVAGSLAVGLTACSSDNDDSSNSSTNADSTSNSSTDAFPTTVATKFGDIEIDEKPEKVVAIGWGDAETPMALGVQPVAAPDWGDYGDDGLGPSVEEKFDESPEIISTSEPEYEIADNDAWKRLPAVENGHGTILPKEVAQSFSMGTPQAYDYGMDKMLPILEKHVAA